MKIVIEILQVGITQEWINGHLDHISKRSLIILLTRKIRCKFTLILLQKEYECEKNNMNSAHKRGAVKNSNTVVGDIYVQDVHKYFGVTKALNGVNFSANFGEIMQSLEEMVVVKVHLLKFYQEFYQ